MVSICSVYCISSLSTHVQHNFYLVSLKGNFRQSWTKVLTHLSKTNAFYRRPSVISKSIFFVDSQHPLSPYSMLQYASWALWPGYNIEKGRGGRNVKIRHWKTHAFNETGLFRGVSQLLLSMIVWTIFYTLWSFVSIITVPSTQRYLTLLFSKLWILSHTSRVQLLHHVGQLLARIISRNGFRRAIDAERRKYVLFWRKFCIFYGSHEQDIRFELFTTVHNGSQRFTSPVKENIRFSLFVWCEPLWTVVNRCKPLWIVAKPTQTIYSTNNIKDKSRKSDFCGWQLFLRTVALSAIACVMPDFCCWVQSPSLLSAKSLSQISRIKIYTDVNLGLYLAVLPYKHDFVVFSRLWTQFVLSETAKYCSTLKRPLMRGDWERVCGKLFCIALKPPNPDLNDK